MACAIFATLQEAQHAADMYALEGFPPDEKNDAGYSWCVDPGVEEWACGTRPVADARR